MLVQESRLKEAKWNYKKALITTAWKGKAEGNNWLRENRETDRVMGKSKGVT